MRRSIRDENQELRGESAFAGPIPETADQCTGDTATHQDVGQIAGVFMNFVGRSGNAQERESDGCRRDAYRNQQSGNHSSSTPVVCDRPAITLLSCASLPESGRHVYI